MADLANADVIFVATHSQGSVVSAHLLDRLIRDGHIRPSAHPDSLVAVATEAVTAGGSVSGPLKTQRVCCLALCGIHLGPLRYLTSSSFTKSYIQVCSRSV